MSHLDQLLRATNTSLRTGDLHTGLRLIDRARRHAPNSGVIAHLYGRLLTMQGDLPAGARRATAPIP